MSWDLIENFMRSGRLELPTLRLWDSRSTDWANSAAAETMTLIDSTNGRFNKQILGHVLLLKTKKLQWRNWLARSTVNRKDGGSSPPWSDLFTPFIAHKFSMVW